MTEAANPRVKVGNNQPPSDEELLKAKHAATFEKVKAWLRRARAADLSPKTEADCAKLEQLFADGRDIANDADRIREAEKEPHLQAGRVIDALFNGGVRDVIGVDPKKGGLARSILQAAADRRLAIDDAERAAAAKRAEAEAKKAEDLAAKAAEQEARGDVKTADVTAARADAAAENADRLATQAADDGPARARSAGGRAVTVGGKLVCTGIDRANLDLDALRPYLDQGELVKAVNKALGFKVFETLKGAVIERRAAARVG